MISTINMNTPCIVQLREEKKGLCECTYETVMLKAVDEVFSSFGQSCKQALYFQLDNTFNVKKREIPFKIVEFADALAQIFGIGAKLVELKIIEQLHKRTPKFIHSPIKDALLFTEYAANLRRFSMIENCKCSKSLPVQRD